MAKVRKRYNQVPHLTQDTTWESNKKYNKHHQQEPRGDTQKWQRALVLITRMISLTAALAESPKSTNQR